MTEPVWITGVGLVSSLGEGAAPHLAALADPAAKPVVDAASFAPFPIHPLPALNLDRQIPKKGDQRQMEPWQRLGTYAAGLAIDRRCRQTLRPRSAPIRCCLRNLWRFLQAHPAVRHWQTTPRSKVIQRTGLNRSLRQPDHYSRKIGRASCRERVL